MKVRMVLLLVALTFTIDRLIVKLCRWFAADEKEVEAFEKGSENIEVGAGGKLSLG